MVESHYDIHCGIRWYIYIFLIHLSLLWYVLLLLLAKNSNFDATGKRYSKVCRYGSENVSWNGCWLSMCADGRSDDRITCPSHRVEFFEFILPRSGQSKIAEETKEGFAGNLLKINIFIRKCNRNFSPEIWMICVCNHFLTSRDILIIEASVHWTYTFLFKLAQLAYVFHFNFRPMKSSLHFSGSNITRSTGRRARRQPRTRRNSHRKISTELPSTSMPENC